MRSLIAATACFFAISVTLFAQSHKSTDEWERDQVADALGAAPAPVTDNARVFAWKAKQLVLVRDGSGPYTCVASGSWSLRIGKPALPYPDPFCADQNAWAYMEAMWKEADPLHPTHALPRAPGLVWMLAGMNVVNGRVSYGQNSASIQAGKSDSKTITMTPHVMILPLSLDASIANLPVTYDPDQPLAMWLMGGGTPTAHLHLHFSPTTFEALKQVK